MPVRRFQATQQTTLRDLTTTMRKIAATSLRINQDIFSGESEIVFDRGSKRYVVRCAKWSDPLDNLRASQLTIRYLHQAMEEYGVLQTEADVDREFARFFLPFEATPDDTVLLLGDGRASWWEVLGVDRTAGREEVMNAYRALARLHHPDVGGNEDDFKRLRAAYEEATRL